MALIFIPESIRIVRGAVDNLMVKGFQAAIKDYDATAVTLVVVNLTFLVLAVLGALIIHFGRERLEIVATTARRAPAQSAMVGLAGVFLLLPVWVLGIVALAVSIIGIPVLLAWVPLFPIAAGIAALAETGPSAVRDALVGSSSYMVAPLRAASKRVSGRKTRLATRDHRQAR